MRKKAIIFMFNILYFSFITHSMDDPIPKADLQNSQTTIQIVDDCVVSQRRKPSPVPAIILTQHSASSSRNLMKTRVESVKKLGEHIASQNTQRTTRQSPVVTRATREKNIDNDDQAPLASLANDPSLIRQKKSFLPQSLDTLAGKKLDQHKKMYTEKEVWELIKSCNPTLYDFGKKYNVDLDYLELLCGCMQELEINPKLITEHIHAGNQQVEKSRMQYCIDLVFGDPYDSHLDSLHKRYEKMKFEDPEGYKAMLLELMKTAADQAEGQQTHRSTIADTHTLLQNQEFANQVQQTRLAIAGLIVTLFTAGGGWAFGLVGQFINPGNCTR